MNDTVPLRSQTEAALARGDHVLARQLLKSLWQAEPSTATAGFVIRSFEAAALAPVTSGLVTLRVFFLATFTIDPLIPLLRAAAFASDIRLSVEKGGFNDVSQLALDPQSALYAFDPQLVFVVHQTRDLTPVLFSDFAALKVEDLRAQEADAVARVRAVVAAVRQGSRAQVVVHGLDTPTEPVLGILDATQEFGQADSIRRINVELARGLRELGGAYLLDSDAVFRRRGAEHMLDARRFASVGLPYASTELLPWVNEWLRFVHPCAGRSAKVVVLDLDNTLWGGVVGEDGFDGIALGQGHKGAPFDALQRAVLDLKQRGILLALCSKNNAADALDVFARHPAMRIRLDDVAAYRINWQDKAQNLRELAVELNVGLDTFVFVDDNPVERAWVREQLPEVTVLELPGSPFAYAACLRACPLFERLSLTAEDRGRSQMYAAERERQQLAQSAGSLGHFLASLGQEVCVAQTTSGTRARVAQLTQKTNQFNLTTRRYSEPEIEALMARPDHALLTIDVRDRFGEHGLVGLAIVRVHGQRAELDTFLLSCRVLSRGVETALLHAVCEWARELGAGTLVAEFIPSKKNTPAKNFLPSHGFVPDAGVASEAVRFELDLAHAPPWPEHIARVYER